MAESHPLFFTATILEWKHLLERDKYKDILIDSLRYCFVNKNITIYAFVILINHVHLIWNTGSQKGINVQHDFLKYTSQNIIKDLSFDNPELLGKFKVDAKDRKYQIWERNPLNIELYTEKVFEQKLNYLHYNPVKAGLCETPESYYYSSANFYIMGKDDFGFLTHYRNSF